MKIEICCFRFTLSAGHLYKQLPPPLRIACLLACLGTCPSVGGSQWRADAQWSQVSSRSSIWGAQTSSGSGGVINLHRFQTRQTATARLGQVGYRIDVEVDHSELGPLRQDSLTSATASSTLSLDDLVVSGPGSTVNVSLNLVLTGALLSSFSDSAEPGTRVWEEVVIRGQLGTNTSGTIEGSCNTYVSSSSETSGLAFPSGWNHSTTNGAVFIKTNPIEVPVNRPVSLFIQLSGIVRLTAMRTLPADGLEHRVHAVSSRLLRFPVGPAVFDLPTGYRVDSADGSIGKNVYVPFLETSVESGALRISWPNDSAANLVLQSTSKMSPETEWIRESDVLRVGSNFYYRVVPERPERFFRLVNLVSGLQNP